MEKKINAASFIPMFKDLRKKMGLTQRKFGLLFYVSAETVKQWESGRNRMPGPAIRLLEIIHYLYEKEKRAKEFNYQLRIPRQLYQIDLRRLRGEL